ncbi:MAG: HD domain-containing protein, partial [Zetaproteobacteria bacterium]
THRPSPKAPPRILVIDDQGPIRSFLCELLAHDFNAQIGTAATLAEAEAQLRKGWDLVITDMTLPDGNALEAITRWQAHEALPPVVLISGFLSEDYIAEAKRLGVAEVLAKPFRPEALLDTVHALLPKTPQHERHRLPELKALGDDLFAMDRKMGFVFKIFSIPHREGAHEITKRALEVAVQIEGAQGGWMALAERARNRLVWVAGSVEPSVREIRLAGSKFEALLESGEEELFWDTEPSWPGLAPQQGFSLPITMQDEPVGVLTLLGVDPAAHRDIDRRQLLALLLRRLDVLLDNQAMQAALAESVRETLIALVRTLEARDRYTKDHSRRVGDLAAKIAREMGLDEETAELVRVGGLLHDIGKVGIPDAVLLKPGRYTEREFAIMKAHPGIGDAILKHMDLLVRERQIVRHHHERMDGRGYPDRLRGEEIPLPARIVCVADAIDAMTTHRVYRKAQPLSFAVEQLRKNAGTQFDPKVVEAALRLIERGEVRSQADEAPSAEILLPYSAREDFITEA